MMMKSEDASAPIQNARYFSLRRFFCDDYSGRFLHAYFSEARPGSSHENRKPDRSGKMVVINPKSGAAPNPMILNQNSEPSSPGFVLVMWLRVASRCISA